MGRGRLNLETLRLEGFAAHPLEVRYSPADEQALTLAETERRLAESFVVGVVSDGERDGIGTGSWLSAGGELTSSGPPVTCRVRSTLV